MEPKFKCPFCGKERRHEASPKAVSVNGRIYFKDVDFFLNLNHVFCTLTCLLNYIDEWHLNAEDIMQQWDEVMDGLEAKHD